VQIDGQATDWQTVDIAACLRVKRQQKVQKTYEYETHSAFAVCAFKFCP